MVKKSKDEDELEAGGEAKKWKPRISIPLREDGTFDLQGMKPLSRQRMLKAIANDPDGLKEFGVTNLPIEGQGIAGAGPVTEEHVNALLNGYELLERWAIPAYIKQQTDGKCVIPSEIANRAFTITIEQRQRLCPSGVRFFNENLPPWALKWLAKAGPGAEFFGGLLMITWTQTHAAIEAWQDSQRPTMMGDPEQPAQPVNGGIKQAA